MLSKTRLGQMTATGAAMLSLFAEWPTDRLAQLHADRAKGSNVGSDYPEFAIENEPMKPGLANRLLPWRRSGDRGVLEEMVSWARSHSPEVLYYRAIDEPEYMWWLPMELSQRLGIPIVTHIMDDWPKRLVDAAKAKDRYTEVERLHDSIRRIFRHSARSLSICDKMSRAFDERYGVPFEAFQNSIDVQEWEGVERTRCVEDDGVFRLVYAGSLAEDMTLGSFVELVEAVGQLRTSGRPVELHVYGARWWKKVFDEHVGKRAGIRYVGFVPREQYLQALRDADLLVMPINFDQQSLVYIRFSLANKGPDYMASGAPILVYGSPEAATVEYAQQQGWAEVVSEQSIDRLASAIVGLMDDAERRRELSARAAQVGRAFHDAEVNRERFRQLMCDVADGR
ncbi:MAG TPA: glycosyltransferase [Phycisphaerales bacterium]|nr:glycosyltransferase [Phycisphaerales bacterium]